MKLYDFRPAYGVASQNLESSFVPEVLTEADVFWEPHDGFCRKRRMVTVRRNLLARAASNTEDVV